MLGGWPSSANAACLVRCTRSTMSPSAATSPFDPRPELLSTPGTGARNRTIALLEALDERLAGWRTAGLDVFEVTPRVAEGDLPGEAGARLRYSGRCQPAVSTVEIASLFGDLGGPPRPGLGTHPIHWGVMGVTPTRGPVGRKGLRADRLSGAVETTRPSQLARRFQAGPTATAETEHRVHMLRAAFLLSLGVRVASVVRRDALTAV
jgi:hypothetical protein